MSNEPHATTDHPSRRWVVAIAVLGVGGVLFTGCGSDDAGEVSAVEEAPSGGSAPLMVIDPAPDGLHIVEATSYEVSGPEHTLHLYGDPDDDRPFVGGDLGIQVFGGGLPADTDAPLGTGRLDASDVSRPLLGVRTLRWRTEDGRGLVASSHSLSSDELVAAVRALDPADPSAPPSNSMPRGLRRVDSMRPTAGATTAIWYGDGDGIEAILEGVSVVAHAGDRRLTTMLEWESGAPATEIEVGGRPGLLLEAPGEHLGLSVAWVDRDDVVVVVRGAGHDEAALRALAEQVRPATAAEEEAADVDRRELDWGSGGPEVDPDPTTAPPTTTAGEPTTIPGLRPGGGA